MGILKRYPGIPFPTAGAPLDQEAAVEHALAMISEGAQIIDIGGESTRPGAAEAPAGLEIERVIPSSSAAAAKPCAHQHRHPQGISRPPAWTGLPDQ